MNAKLTVASLTGGLLLASHAIAAPVQSCYQNVCSTIETPSACIEEGQETELTVEGVMEGTTGTAFTAYQVVADAEWRYNSNHQVELVNGKTIDSSGFHLGSQFNKKYKVKGGEAKKYTFIYGSRVFGHGFYDVAVDLELGEGAGGGSALQVDIKPGSCENPLNYGKKGVTPVVVLGTESVDVRTLALDSIRLEGVAPVQYSYEDSGTSLTDSSDCYPNMADGQDDLNLKFLSQHLNAAIEAKLGREPFDGEIVELELTAMPAGAESDSACGSGFSGSNTVQMLVKGKNKK